jgi:hypothetical protein
VRRLRIPKRTSCRICPGHIVRLPDDASRPARSAAPSRLSVAVKTAGLVRLQSVLTTAITRPGMSAVRRGPSAGRQPRSASKGLTQEPAKPHSSRCSPVSDFPCAPMTHAARLANPP